MCRTVDGSSCVPSLCGLFVILLFALWTVPVHAQPEQIETLVSAGIELRLQDRSEEALKYFRRAAELAPDSARVQGHLALALHATGDWLESERPMKAALASNDDWVVRHKDELARSLEAVRGHLAWLQVDAPGRSELWIDARLASPLPMQAPLRVLAGGRRLSLRTQGRAPIDKMLDVPPGGHLYLSLVDTGTDTHTVRTSTAQQYTPATTERPRGGANRTLGAALLGAGTAAMVACVSLGVHALVLRQERDSECDQTGCTTQGRVLDARGRQAAAYANVFAAAGLASLGAGGLLLWFNPGGAPSRSQPNAGHGSVGASLLLRW